MRHYRGLRGPNGCVVTVDGEPLSPRHDLHPAGAGEFEWGYEGDGPSRLAIAILADHFANSAKVLSLYPRFRRDVIAPINSDEWTFDSAAIDRALGSVTDVPMTLVELLAKVRTGG